jgi:signal transduction histidine kinase
MRGLAVVRELPTPPVATTGLVQVGLALLDAEGDVLHADGPALHVMACAEEVARGKPLAQLLRLGEGEHATLCTVLDGAVARQTISFRAPFDGVERELTIQPMPDVTATRFVAQFILPDDYLVHRRARAQVELRTTIESIIGGFAHEVRNPLASILSLVEASIEDFGNLGHDASDLVRVPALVARIEGLLRQSLAYSRPKCPRVAIHKLDALLETTISLLKPSTRERLVLPDPVADAYFADADQMSQVLINLLENAGDAAASQLRLGVRRAVGPDGAVLLVDVVDDGAGVPAALHQRIFEPFFTTKAHGTGLGLAIARDLARLNGGDLVLDTTGQGHTVFTLRLPTTARTTRR